jgi:PTH1 family peptidyl-tRNA hydrolase
MRLLAGLGNPGAEYAHTRHNAGFDLVDQMAKQLGSLTWKEFKGGLVAKEGESLLFKHTQYMNRSGLPLRQVVDYYKIELSDICIATDDVYIAPGSARIRHTGADGGHNGWKSVIEQLGSEHFWRVRIGVGIYEQHPEHRIHQPALDDYVLQRPPAHDAKRVGELIDKITPNLVEWLRSGQIEEQTVHS